MTGFNLIHRSIWSFNYFWAIHTVISNFERKILWPNVFGLFQKQCYSDVQIILHPEGTKLSDWSFLRVSFLLFLRILFNVRPLGNGYMLCSYHFGLACVARSKWRKRSDGIAYRWCKALRWYKDLFVTTLLFEIKFRLQSDIFGACHQMFDGK